MEAPDQAADVRDDAPQARPPSWRDVATRPLTIGLTLMGAGSALTGVGILAYLMDEGRGTPLGRLARAALQPETAMYGLAVVVVLLSLLLLIVREQEVSPLVFALLGIAVLLVIPLTVLLMDIAPWGFGGRLTNGSPSQVVLIFSPLVALAGWVVAALELRRGSSVASPSADATVASSGPDGSEDH